MTIDIPECMAHLPVYNGMPVPWIAAWSAEVEQQATIGCYELGGGIRPLDGSAKIVVKEGGLWMLTVPTNRTGHPLFGETHSARQRDCMTTGRCQVCGKLPAETGLEPLWTVPAGDVHRGLFADGLFINPPTCPPCLEAAKGICPHLKQNRLETFRGAAKLREYDCEMYWGPATGRIRVPLGNKYLKYCLVKQYIIKLFHSRTVTR